MVTFTQHFKKRLDADDIEGALRHLAAFEDQSEPDKLGVIHELALAPDEAALKLLGLIAGLSKKETDIHERIIQLVIDRTHINFRFAEILYTKGTSRQIRNAAPLLRHILSNETDAGILAATLHAAGAVTLDTLTDDIAEHLYFDDPRLKTEAIKALTRIGSSLALTRLRQAAKTTKRDSDILDAIKLLSRDSLKNKDDRGYKDNRADSDFKRSAGNLLSDDLHVRFSAFNAISGMGATLPLTWITESLQSGNHDLMVNTLKIIQRSLRRESLTLIFDLVNRSPADALLSFNACEALGGFPKLDSPAVVLQCLDHTDLHVRMAAVRTLDRHMTDLVSAEIKNRIETGRKRGEALTEIILDVQAETLIDFLTQSDTFSFIASNYLTRQASPQAIESYIRILNNRGLRSSAKRFENALLKKNDPALPKAMVVSDSFTVQRYYGRLLSRLNFTSVFYRSPQTAFEAAYTEKPALILSDLFFSAMTGVDFAKEIRGIYPAKDLPVILSTMQKTFASDEFKSICQKDGITTIELFPVSASAIREAVHA